MRSPRAPGRCVSSRSSPRAAAACPSRPGRTVPISSTASGWASTGRCRHESTLMASKGPSRAVRSRRVPTVDAVAARPRGPRRSRRRAAARPPAGRPRHPGAHRAATAPTPTSSCPRCWRAAGWPTGTGPSSPSSSYGTTRHAAGLRLARRPLRPPRPGPPDPRRAAARRLPARLPRAPRRTPPSSATVEAVRPPGPRPRQRRAAPVADAEPPRWPDDAMRLSYPDWIVDAARRRPRRTTTRSPPSRR